MKNIINKLFRVCSLAAVCAAFVTCQQQTEKKESPKTSQQIVDEATTVLAIGKVVPAEGYTVFSSPVAGLVKEIYFDEGDDVKAGDLIIRLDESRLSLDVASSKVELESLAEQRKSQSANLRKEELKLAELQQKYETSRMLYDKQAETKENMQDDWNAWKQQQQVLLSLQQELKASTLQEKKQQLNIEKTEQDYEDLSIRAEKGGTIVELLADVGQSVSVATVLGRMANIDSLLVEAEVDELFVDKVALGQTVSFYAVGNKNLLGTGKIVSLSPTLTNKSILYERANEGDDRRVRRMKIKPDRVDGLLINAKVDCQIQLR